MASKRKWRLAARWPPPRSGWYRTHYGDPERFEWRLWLRSKWHFPDTVTLWPRVEPTKGLFWIGPRRSAPGLRD